MINVLEILKQLPEWTKVYFVLSGKMEEFEIIGDENAYYQIGVGERCLTSQGQYFKNEGECVIFPSADHRTWSDWKKYYGIFKRPQLKPFDKVLVRNFDTADWTANFFSHYDDNAHPEYPNITVGGSFWRYCIPYEGNEHLLGKSGNLDD